MDDQIVLAADGRRLTVRELGSHKGTPVFFLHGTPGCRLGPHPRSSLLYRLGVRLIAYDRPGYGGSDRLPRRQVVHAASDVEAIADHLEIERFAVVGRSGGGPHALACAAMLPKRVERAAALVSLAPRDARGLDWYAGMAEPNVRCYSTAEAGLLDLAHQLEATAQRIRSDDAHHFKTLAPHLSVADARVMGDTEIRIGFRRAFAEALRISGGGWVDDTRSFIEDWGFEPAQIDVPVLLWHGDADAFSPINHTLWLSRRIPGAALEIARGSAHFGAMEHVPDVLSWAVTGRQPPALCAA